ncbi:hypothetical protein HIM_01071 [Hirsutella minnesotensis 3608]|nr:hypothetical protein HIM_01071 [Hirsutella minnesotensis 3608]
MVNFHVKKAALLVATALAGAAFATEDPAIYAVIFTDDCDTTSFVEAVTNLKGTVIEQFDNDNWKGASVQFENLEFGETAAVELENHACVDSWDRSLAFTVPSETFEVVSDETPEEPLELEGEDGEDNLKLRARATGRGPRRYVPHVMSQVDQMYARNITGEGIKVAILDSGIDYNHPALGNGCFGPGCLVEKGHDFVGDDFKAWDPQTKAVQDSDPMDCDGHGTHVAGIVAAQPGHRIIGAAPGVKLRAYRITSCHGSSRLDIILAGLNRAYKDKADIISISMGIQGDHIPTSFGRVISKIVQKGVPILVAAGNDGAQGLFYMNAISHAKGATMISAFLNHVQYDELHSITYSVGGGSKRTGAVFVGEPGNWDNVSLPLWAGNVAQPAFNACVPLPGDTPDLSNKIVLLPRDETCRTDDAIPNLTAKGARYIICAAGSGQRDFLPYVMLSQFPDVVGAASVSYERGQYWLKSLRKGREVVVHMPPSANVSTTYRPLPDPGAGSLLEQTSWGPAFDLGVKPQFGAAGGNILSTYPMSLGKYSIVSGTSMATPLAAAVYALIFQARGKMSPADMERLVSNTAEPALFHDGTNFVLTPSVRPAPVAQQGGGLIKAFRAAYATTAIEPPSISFKDADTHVDTVTLTVTNSGMETVTYKVNHHPSLTMYVLDQDSTHAMPFPNEIVHGVSARVQAEPRELTLGPNEAAQVRVSVEVPSSSQVDPTRLPYYSGYLFFDQSDGSSMTVPYQGVAGSLGNAKVLAPDSPWISDMVGGNRVADNTTFTISPQSRQGRPGLEMRMVLDTALVHVYAVPDDVSSAGAGNVTEILGQTTVGEISGFPVKGRQRVYEYRNEWDGKLASGKRAPAGTYKLVTMALRFWGNATNKDDYDVGETSLFTIDYA